LCNRKAQFFQTEIDELQQQLDHVTAASSTNIIPRTRNLFINDTFENKEQQPPRSSCEEEKKKIAWLERAAKVDETTIAALEDKNHTLNRVRDKLEHRVHVLQSRVETLQQELDLFSQPLEFDSVQLDDLHSFVSFLNTNPESNMVRVYRVLRNYHNELIKARMQNADQEIALSAYVDHNQRLQKQLALKQ
jgi:hypothetical protein